MPIVFRVLLLVSLGAITSGCGSKLVTVKGKLTKDGQPLEVSDRGAVMITFIPYVEGGSEAAEGHSAPVMKDGSYHVLGRYGKGIAPGKYRIAVQHLDPYPRNDKLKGEFSTSQSPIIREVTGADLDIDLAKPSG